MHANVSTYFELMKHNDEVLWLVYERCILILKVKHLLIRATLINNIRRHAFWIINAAEFLSERIWMSFLLAAFWMMTAALCCSNLISFRSFLPRYLRNARCILVAANDRLYTDGGNCEKLRMGSTTMEFFIYVFSNIWVISSFSNIPFASFHHHLWVLYPFHQFQLSLGNLFIN